MKKAFCALIILQMVSLTLQAQDIDKVPWQARNDFCIMTGKIAASVMQSRKERIRSESEVRSAFQSLLKESRWRFGVVAESILDNAIDDAFTDEFEDPREYGGKVVRSCFDLLDVPGR